MIVDRHRARLIETGVVTEQRLPRQLKPPQLRASRCTYLQIATVSGPRCVVEVLSVRLEQHHERSARSETALAALGFATLDEYIARWLLDRDTAWLARRAGGELDAHPTTLNAAEAALSELSKRQLQMRWRQRWADRSVWSVRWLVQHDLPLLLPERPGGGHPDVRLPEHLAAAGYIVQGRAARHEPEAIDTDELNPGWARAGVRRHREARAGKESAPVQHLRQPPRAA